ncbi:glycoside hydrolase family 18 protein [Gelatoporia subvermispora B]|uniref:chitinase n=1 Tax=Ceriporiopsis subvermispora (strain B) TaxID=914234 RepID=M2R6R9_CERS8|nr:glycoside hydrolase family 18 protein [Gelatoporia subvermispora B]
MAVVSRLTSFSRLGALVASLFVLPALGFNNAAQDNVADYWGQNSYGATNSNQALWQQPISFYCSDDSIDAFPVAFLNVFFSSDGLPSIDLANTCNVNDDAVFSGTQLPDCSFLASDIETCQAAGKIVTMSLGGATGAAGFTSDSQASEFATTIWDLFLGGSSSTRPFGSAVLDGVDLDIEGGSTEYFPTFVSSLRSLMNSGSKQYYITAAPQCPFPDAYVGSVINAEPFDAVYVQFYNNYCELTEFSDPNDWDFSVWDNWAKTTSPNPNVKVYIGAPAAQAAAGSGYVDASTLANIAIETRNQYSSFGGVMLWDASQAYANGNFAAAIKSAIAGGGSAPAPPPTTAPTTPAPTPTPTPTPTTAPTSAPSPAPTAGNCAGVNAWVANVAYTGGDEVMYGGDLWTAKWWSYGDTPGGVAGDWQNDGACVAAALAPGEFIKAHYESKSIPLTVKPKATAPLQTVAAAKGTSRKSSRDFRA